MPQELIDMQMTLFDDKHARKAINGQEIPGTIERKVISQQQANELVAGEKKDWRTGNMVPANGWGGDVGNQSTTAGQVSQRAAETVGLDYSSPRNSYLDNPTAPTPGWSDYVTKDGVIVAEQETTQQMLDVTTMPYGTDATRMVQADEQRRAGNVIRTNPDGTRVTEYVPDAMRSTTDATTGQVAYPHLSTRDRTSAADPMNGWCFTATERMGDPQNRHITPNIETTRPELPYNDTAQLSRLSTVAGPDGAVPAPAGVAHAERDRVTGQIRMAPGARSA